LGAVVKRKIPSPCRDSNLPSSSPYLRDGGLDHLLLKFKYSCDITDIQLMVYIHVACMGTREMDTRLGPKSSRKIPLGRSGRYEESVNIDLG
jgi:hypothetical protein